MGSLYKIMFRALFSTTKSAPLFNLIKNEKKSEEIAETPFSGCTNGVKRRRRRNRLLCKKGLFLHFVTKNGTLTM